MANEFVPIHQHLILNLTVPGVLETEEAGKEFLLDMVQALHMVPVTPPQCVNIRTPGNEGPTGSINLATSHVAFHHWERNGLLMLDVYSCCSFNNEVTLLVVEKYFGKGIKGTAIVLDRSDMRSEVFEISRPDITTL